MVIEELVADIQERFRTGQRRNEIKEDLMNQGFDEEDLDDTIAKIQRDAIKQLPGISLIYRYIEHFESHPKATSAKTTILLMGTCIAFLVLLAVALFFFLDPLGTRSSGRDVKRQADVTIIENGLTQYFQKTNRYPDTLDQMVPGSLSDVPRDPQTGAEYSYQPLDNNENYKLCVSYEQQQQQQQCVNASSVSSDIPMVPTDTPVPTFAPQSATGSAVRSHAM